MATIIKSRDDRNDLVNLDRVDSIETTGFNIIFKIGNKEVVWSYSKQQNCKDDYQDILLEKVN